MRLAQQEEEDRRIRVEMKSKEEQALAVEEQFGNIQEEVEIKTKKLKKLWLKYQESETNLKDEKKAFQVIRLSLSLSRASLPFSPFSHTLCLSHSSSSSWRRRTCWTVFAI